MEQEIIRGLLALGLIITINVIEFIESGIEKRQFKIKGVLASCIIVVLIMGIFPIIF